MGIKVGTGDSDALPCCFGTKFCRDEIGTPTDEIDSGPRRHADLHRAKLWPGNGTSPVWSRTRQRREAVVRQRDGLVDRSDVGARLRYAGFGLRLRPARIDPHGDALRRQPGRGNANRERVERDCARGMGLRKFGISGGDRRRQQQSCLSGIDCGRRCFATCRAKCRAVAPPQVEVERKTTSDTSGVLDPFRHEGGRDAEILTLLGPAGGRIEPDRGQPRRSRLLRQRIGCAEPCGSERHVGRAG